MKYNSKENKHSFSQIMWPENNKKFLDERINEVNKKSEELKERGVDVVRLEYIGIWKHLVSVDLNKENPFELNQEILKFWNNYYIFLAALECMESLSENNSIEEAYKIIDSEKYQKLFSENKIEIFKNKVIAIVSIFHNKCDKFYSYAKKKVNNAILESDNFVKEKNKKSP